MTCVSSKHEDMPPCISRCPTNHGSRVLIDKASLQHILARQLSVEILGRRRIAAVQRLRFAISRFCCLRALVEMADQGNRPHRTTKEKKPHTGGPNPKAFAYAAPGRLQKTAARSHDVHFIFTCYYNSHANIHRSKKSAFTSPSSTAFPKKHRPSSSASLALPA
jgi:hypothetical protein